MLYILCESWCLEWVDFLWNMDDMYLDVVVWKQGWMGELFVDVVMCEFYVMGKMYNWVWMIVVLYLMKYLLSYWKIGMDWFVDCLIDWDFVSNVMGWQWVVGLGLDVVLYFCIFNLVIQVEKFDL